MTLRRIASVNRQAAIAVVAILCLLNVACASQDLNKVASALHDVTASVTAAKQALTQASQQHLISDAAAVKVAGILLKVQQGEQEANKLTRAYSTLPAGSKPQLAAIITPIIAAVDDGLATGLVGVDGPTAAKIQGYLSAIKSGLLIVQSVVGA